FLLFGVISSFLHKPTMLHAAAQLDKNGFKERIATAVECIEKKEDAEYNRFEEHLIFDTEQKMKENTAR
ncbi:MAG: hypothetical protein MJ252_11860, partial [archaeon]|nr:hypothetical protein [archaeon]